MNHFFEDLRQRNCIRRVYKHIKIAADGLIQHIG